MRNGVGLQGPDLTAGTPLYTPDELGVEDPDADVAPVTEPVDADAVEEADAPDGAARDDPSAGDLTGAAREGGTRRRRSSSWRASSTASRGSPG